MFPLNIKGREVLIKVFFQNPQALMDSSEPGFHVDDHLK